MAECEFLKDCSFFQKYQNTKDLVCKGFILQYCKGPKMEQCERRKLRKSGKVPPADMMPTGQMMASK